MKKSIISILTITTLIYSCNAPSDIEALKKQRQELRSEKDKALGEFDVKLKELDSLIAAIDTTEKDVKKTAVTIVNLEKKTFEHFFEVHGNVEVVENAALYAEAPGTVEKIHVQEGQAVNKGDLIISLDASTIKSSIEELKKGLELATKIYQKQKSLWEQNIGSEIQYLEAKTNKESLEQKLTTLNSQLDMYKITAPFNGIVDAITPKIGEAANPGFPVARVLNLNKIYLESDVSEAYLNTVKQGSLVAVKFPSLGEEVMAKVTRTGNYINPANRTFKVRVEFANPAGKYKPNQLAIMKIRDFKADSAFVIPTRVIQQDRQGNDYIYTYGKDNDLLKVEKLLVSIVKSYEGFSMIEKSPSDNLPVLDKGSRNVQPGDAIELK